MPGPMPYNIILSRSHKFHVVWEILTCDPIKNEVYKVFIVFFLLCFLKNSKQPFRNYHWNTVFVLFVCLI